MKHTKKSHRVCMIVACLAGLTLAGCAAMPGSKATAKAWMTECGMTAAQKRCIFNVTKKYNASTGVSDRFTLKKFRHIYKTAAAWRKTSGRYCPKLAKKERQRIYQTARSCLASALEPVHGSVGLRVHADDRSAVYRHALLEQAALNRQATRHGPGGQRHTGVARLRAAPRGTSILSKFAKACEGGGATHMADGTFKCRQ